MMYWHEALFVKLQDASSQILMENNVLQPFVQTFMQTLEINS